MSVDIFEFWSQVGPEDKLHPKDRDVLSRMETSHGFDLRCLPGCFIGPLKTAPVVLLYLSPGWTEFDLEDARTSKGRNRVMECRKGEQMLPGPENHKGAWEWWKRRTSKFGDWQVVRNKIAVFDIGAYHSKKFSDAPLLAALPSSRACLDWAQAVLFPQAVAGERVVVCMRSANYWGLDAGKAGRKYGEALYAPRVTRGGDMRHDPLREEIIKAVKAAVARD